MSTTIVVTLLDDGDVRVEWSAQAAKVIAYGMLMTAIDLIREDADPVPVKEVDVIKSKDNLKLIKGGLSVP